MDRGPLLRGGEPPAETYLPEGGGVGGGGGGRGGYVMDVSNERGFSRSSRFLFQTRFDEMEF